MFEAALKSDGHTVVTDKQVRIETLDPAEFFIKHILRQGRGDELEVYDDNEFYR